MKLFDVRALINNRKNLYMILTIIFVSIFTLSIAYAVLSTTLNITGSTEIASSSWNIYLDNIEIRRGSVEASPPEISGTSSVSFDVDLTLPGDFYEFTVDVVNDGSIDAMIDSVVKTPELTTDQAKYIKYEITYENGESINEKQTLKKETTTPIKVRIEYRKDLSVSDLPSTTTELSLGLTLVYIQSDGSGTDVKNNGVELPEGYVRLNYIESTGTQYIDTKFIFKTTTSIDISFSVIAYNTSAKMGFFGSYESDGNPYQLYASGTGNKKFYAIFGGSITDYQELEAITLNKRYNIFMKNKEITINDNIYNVKTAIGDAKKSMYLFYRNSVGGKAKMTLYSCKIYDDGILVRDFIPCSRKSDGLIGLYDMVTKEFYINAGTGEFIGG